MATPTKAELFNQLAHACRIINEFWKYCQSNTRNFKDDSDSFQQTFEGNHIAATQAALVTFRESLGGLIQGGRALLEPILQDLARIGYNSIEDTTDAMLVDIFDGMEAATETIQARDWTYANLTTGGSNNGNGTVYRLVTDKDEYDIESGSAVGGTVKLECIRDKHHGLEEGQEEFAIYGSGKDAWDVLDLGTAPSPKGLIYSTRAHDGLLTNPSFDTYTATTFSSATDLNGWNFLSSYANYSIDTANYFRREPGETTGNSLKNTASDTIYQNLTDAAGSLDPSSPAMLVVRYNREVGSAAGSIKIYLGATTETINLASETGWNDARIIDDSGIWYDNFKQDVSGNGLQIKIETTISSGYLLIDEVILVQPQMYDGKWYLITAGGSDYLKNDYFSFGDTVTNTGVIQYWISRLFGRYLPHDTGTPTYSDTPT